MQRLLSVTYLSYYKLIVYFMKTILLISVLVVASFVGRTQCQADFTTSVSNGTVTFTNNSQGNSLNYYWDFGDGASSSAQNPTHTYSSVGGYIACLTIYSNDSLCQDVFCDSVEILSLDTLGGGCMTSFTYTTNSQGIFCTNTTTAGSNFFYSYWDVYDANNTLVCSGGTVDFNCFPSASGMYSVCLTTYDSVQNFCGMECELIFFNNDSLDSNLGFFFNEFIFKSYPNPVQEELMVELENPEAYHIMIQDASGRSLVDVDVVNQLTKIDVSHLARGMYVLKIVNDGGKSVSTRKILKE